ncbi:glycosyltransferase involved in cell wall biosynthesis [Dysgonomonas sp. PFB1-18]|uniref:glycosyltransferase family 4 protein n=1 Tax=unclassified Dysgonomonas TaxID=2630389 RepID=UPI002476F49A|nr:MULTISPECIES: glycosyltransferase family 4 protein [unclassified Dysgonomonas]MDH6308287.1 glycosyltransferase involved in cell wall biosynthesis [Dysgonomonas sp. PF1-14]MDH6338275.1 glycosyltransferase involved in cell wall biosynthesis [Dysgonomonas sp. PF1-16]MDH6379772.1 glycosyltransferase involved in cell wall biosynthesis [Dysgonomonas sp. PFB1-18]MDH6397138.1 glycosyltransferase involved in cell wall biosynthesis [Dysgonomonas sp. PF1-23]
MNKIKVIISAGIGPLHFMKSAVYIYKLTDLSVIQSWIPKNTDGWFVRLLSKLIKHKHLSTGLKKRKPVELKDRNYSCALPDFFLWGGVLINRIIKYPSRRNLAGWAWRLYGFQSRKYIKNAEIFHVRSGAGQGGAIRKAKGEGMKIIVDHSIAHPAYMDKHLANEYMRNHEIFTLGMKSPLFQYTVKDAEMADRVVVNSFFVKKTFIEQGFPEEKLKVIYLGVREDFISLKTDYTVGESVKLLFTGGFGFRKGAEYLLKALQTLEQQNIKFEMKVIGSYEEAIPLIKKYPVKSINFLGFIPQDELKEHLKESDIYIFPSLCEGCASSGMEALAAGLPVIATEESGLPISNGVDGIIIPSKDCTAIANSIMNLCVDKEKMECLGRNATKNIQENYTWEKYASQFKELYTTLLNK